MEVTTAISEYNPIASALAGVEKYRGLVCDVSSPKGLAEAKAAHKEVAALRIALEKTRKKVKEEVVARGKLIDGEANRIFELIAAIEVPIKDQIDAQERREQEAREAAVRAEQERIASEERAKREAEERKLAEERERNASEARRLAEERARLEAEDRRRREALEAEERAAKARIAEQEAAARKVREAEEAKLAAAREAIARERRMKEEADRKAREEEEARARAERAAAEAKERAEREAKEALERERRRRVAEQADARTMLELFRKRYGHLEEYARVVKAIDECLEPA